MLIDRPYHLFNDRGQMRLNELAKMRRAVEEQRLLSFSGGFSQSPSGTLVRMAAAAGVAVKVFRAAQLASLSLGTPTGIIYDGRQLDLQADTFVLAPADPEIKVWLLAFMGLQLVAGSPAFPAAGNLYAAFDSGETRSAQPQDGGPIESRPVWYVLGGWVVAQGAVALCNADNTVTVSFHTY